jgi:hypothetical protein
MEALHSCAGLNHAASADPSFSSGEHFSVNTGSLNCDASLANMPICASACTKIFILTLIVNIYNFLFYPYLTLLLCNSS